MGAQRSLRDELFDSTIKLAKLCAEENNLDLDIRDTHVGARNVVLTITGESEIAEQGKLKIRTSDSHVNFTNELIAILIDLRNEARNSKDFILADLIRDRLSAIKVDLRDHKDGGTSFSHNRILL